MWRNEVFTWIQVVIANVSRTCDKFRGEYNYVVSEYRGLYSTLKGTTLNIDLSVNLCNVVAINCTFHFCQQRSNRFFGHFRMLTSSFCKQITLIVTS